MVAAELAKEAGIHVPPAMVCKFNNDHNTFLTGRFDRAADGSRLHFASAKTLLGKVDGEGGSYLDLAEFIMRYGGNTEADLQELWKRIIFNMAVKNTDDHLRNHGFMLTPAGWTLSPAYDVNPVFFGRGLTLNVDEKDNSLSFDLGLSVAGYFRVEHQDAFKVVDTIKNIVRHWHLVAKKYSVSSRELDLMATAFDLVA